MRRTTKLVLRPDYGSVSKVKLWIDGELVKEVQLNDFTGDKLTILATRTTKRKKKDYELSYKLRLKAGRHGYLRYKKSLYVFRVWLAPSMTVKAIANTFCGDMLYCGECRLRLDKKGKVKISYDEAKSRTR